jgi:hypothetical protein
MSVMQEIWAPQEELLAKDEETNQEGGFSPFGH